MAWRTDGVRVKISKAPSSTILFARNGSATVLQIETVETVEVRGLTQAAAEAFAGVTHSDDFAQTSYYAFIDGEVFSFTETSGTKVEKVPRRSNEANGWTVTETTTVYTSQGRTNIWGTKPLNADGKELTLSSNGESRVVSVDTSSSFVVEFFGMVLSTTVKTTVEEVRYIDSEASAKAIVDAHSQVPSHVMVHTPYSYPDKDHPGSVIPASYAFQTITLGDEKFASARYISPKEGWCVTKTTKTHGFNGNGWSR